MKIDFRKNSKSLLIVWLLLIILFIGFIVFPLFCVLLSAGIKDFKLVLSSAIFKESVKNTFFECIFSSLAAVIIGYFFAYAVVKTNIPFKRFFSYVPLVHLMTPPFVGGLAFILLIGRQGFITHTLLGLDISLYGFKGLVIAQSLCFFPLSYLICLQSLQGINQNLEQAARSMGAGSLKIFFTITLPLSFSGIISSFLFVAVNVLSDFGNPLIVAGRFRVLAVEIYTQLTGWLNIKTSAVLGIILVIPSVILFLIQNYLLKKQLTKASMNLNFNPEKYYKSSLNSDVKNFSRPATIIFSFFVIVVSICVVLQFVAIIFGSFQKLWGINTTFTLNHIKSVLSGRYSVSLKNSVSFALVSAVLSTVIAVFSSYVVHRTEMPLKKTLDIFAQIPSSIPGSLLGLAILLASKKVGFNNSFVLIIIAMTVAFLPFSYRIISQSYSTIKTTLDDGSRSLGANQLFTLTKIIVPLSADGIFGGFIYDFIRGVGTLSAVIFLVSFNTPLTSINIVNLAEQGDWGKSASLALILTVLTFGILAIGIVVLNFLKKHKE